MPSYIVIGDNNNIAQKVKSIFMGNSDNIAHKIKNIYIGDTDGKAQQAYRGIYTTTVTYYTSAIEPGNMSSTTALTRSSASGTSYSNQTGENWYVSCKISRMNSDKTSATTYSTQVTSFGQGLSCTSTSTYQGANSTNFNYYKYMSFSNSTTNTITYTIYSTSSVRNSNGYTNSSSGTRTAINNISGFSLMLGTGTSTYGDMTQPYPQVTTGFFDYRTSYYASGGYVTITTNGISMTLSSRPIDLKLSTIPSFSEEMTYMTSYSYSTQTVTTLAYSTQKISRYYTIRSTASTSSSTQAWNNLTISGTKMQDIDGKYTGTSASTRSISYTSTSYGKTSTTIASNSTEFGPNTFTSTTNTGWRGLVVTGSANNTSGARYSTNTYSYSSTQSSGSYSTQFTVSTNLSSSMITLNNTSSCKTQVRYAGGGGTTFANSTVTHLYKATLETRSSFYAMDTYNLTCSSTSGYSGVSSSTITSE